MVSRFILYEGEVCRVVEAIDGDTLVEFSKGWTKGLPGTKSSDFCEEGKKYWWVGEYDYSELIDCELARVIYG